LNLKGQGRKKGGGMRREGGGGESDSECLKRSSRRVIKT